LAHLTQVTSKVPCFFPYNNVDDDHCDDDDEDDDAAADDDQNQETLSLEG